MTNENASQSIVDNLFDVGEAWASYGLKIAELALKTSARTLENISAALGTLSEQLKNEKDENVIDTHTVTGSPGGSVATNES